MNRFDELESAIERAVRNMDNSGRILGIETYKFPDFACRLRDFLEDEEQTAHEQARQSYAYARVMAEKHQAVTV